MFVGDRTFMQMLAQWLIPCIHWSDPTSSDTTNSTKYEKYERVYFTRSTSK